MEQIAKLQSTVDKVLEIALDTSSKQTETAERLAQLEKNPTLERVLNLAIETSAKQGEVVARLTHIEDQHAHTFNKIDGFLTLINRHETELTSIQVNLDRIRERLDAVEKVA